MFQFCEQLEYLDLSNFNITKVTNMVFMFAFCHKLKEIKGINNFNNFKKININGIFQDYKELDLYNFNSSDEIKNKYKDLLSALNSINSNIIEFFDVKEKINVNFNSIDNKINFSISCYTIDILHSIQERLYLDFPELKNKNINFFSNGFS